MSDYTKEKPWNLYYWPGIKGRGEYVRLIFEEAGVPYVDVCQTSADVSVSEAWALHTAAAATSGEDNPLVAPLAQQQPSTSTSTTTAAAADKPKPKTAAAMSAVGMSGFKQCLEFVWKGGNPGYPARAPPAIERDGVTISNTPAVQGYLGRKYGLYPDGLEEQAYVDQILAVVTDGVADGRLAFHPKDFYASHKSQVEESKPYIEQYGKDRLPKYMSYFESLLQRATPEEDGSRYLVADRITAADLSVYHFLEAAQQHFPAYYDAIDSPLCKAFKDQIARRPRIAAYLQSSRCLPWDEDSMM